ncbi:hypothetical protein HTZ97_09375 [Desulfuromonas acetoxidans]|nr:hypothetical protein [Desulfuromonas acetoxidans]MBF0646408.1 hypothetical protein [Desulfuromonas acetoxidans]NVD24377.1 hypothetical protein [Desulfuromonas acetoxidans]NVE16675.1 hypothetical protein [Desulfuromonas acetoxidans]
MPEPVCGHCRAKRPNLHCFHENAYKGKFQVVRCLLCGWQISRYVPSKKYNAAWRRQLLLTFRAEMEESRQEASEFTDLWRGRHF